MENANQMLNLTREEMLNYYKTLTHTTPVLRDCTLERADGIDLDAYMLQRLDQWYATVLAQAPAEFLPIDDVKDEVRLTLLPSGVVSANVPARCVRPVEWMLSDWRHSVTLMALPGSPQALAQRSPWTQAGPNDPVIVDHGNHLLLCSTGSATPTLSMARCVVRPANGQFTFHPAVLTQHPLPAINN